MKKLKSQLVGLVEGGKRLIDNLWGRIAIRQPSPLPIDRKLFFQVPDPYVSRGYYGDVSQRRGKYYHPPDNGYIVGINWDGTVFFARVTQETLDLLEKGRFRKARAALWMPRRSDLEAWMKKAS